MVRLLEIRETVEPMASTMRNAYIDFSKMTTSVVAVITDVERAEAEAHLDACTYCRKRYRFEEKLRQFVHQAVQEPMPVELKTRLAELRTPLQ